MDAVNAICVRPQGVQELSLLICGIESVKKRSDCWFVCIYAILDEILLLEALEAGLGNLIEEAAALLLTFPGLHFSN